MEFFKIRKDIPFMRHALVFNVISLITFVLAVVFLATKGLNLSVDFTGGTVMEVNYAQSADLSFRAVLGSAERQIDRGELRCLAIRSGRLSASCSGR